MWVSEKAGKQRKEERTDIANVFMCHSARLSKEWFVMLNSRKGRESC
jgi:hypothetical protein